MVVLVSISVSFFYSEKNFHAKKIRSEKFSENEKEENDVSEKFFYKEVIPITPLIWWLMIKPFNKH